MVFDPVMPRIFTLERYYFNANVYFSLQKRVLVIPNGESIDRAAHVWGESLQQLLDNATQRLNLRKQATILYTYDGVKVSGIYVVRPAPMAAWSKADCHCFSPLPGFSNPNLGM